MPKENSALTVEGRISATGERGADEWLLVADLPNGGELRLVVNEETEKYFIPGSGILLTIQKNIPPPAEDIPS